MTSLIDRNQAILAVCSVCSAVRPEYRGEKCMYFADGCEEIERLRELPSAQPVRHGKWISKSTGGEYFDCCSECGYVEWDAPNNYCPNCGARMDAE